MRLSPLQKNPRRCTLGSVFVDAAGPLRSWSFTTNLCPPVVPLTSVPHPCASTPHPLPLRPTPTYPFFSPTFQHVPIRKKEKCPPSPPKDCSLKVGEGCKDCNERDCEWNDTDKKCLKECYDDDKCVRSKDRCPAVSSPLLRKGGVRQIHVGGLDLTR